MKKGDVFESFCAVCKKVAQHMQLGEMGGSKSACRHCRIVKEWAREHDSCFLPMHKEPHPAGEGFVKAKLSGGMEYAEFSASEWKAQRDRIKLLEEKLAISDDRWKEARRCNSNQMQTIYDKGFRIKGLQEHLQEREAAVKLGSAGLLEQGNTIARLEETIKSHLVSIRNQGDVIAALQKDCRLLKENMVAWRSLAQLAQRLEGEGV